MTELKDVLEAILTDLIEARHVANDYSQSLSSLYGKDAALAGFSTPSVDIGNVKIDIKFAVEQPDPGAGDSGRVTLDKAVISGAIKKAAINELGSSDKLIFKNASDNSANKAALSNKIATIIAGHINPSTLKVSKTKALAETKALMKPHLGKAANGRDIPIRVIDSSIASMIVNAEKELLIAREEAAKAKLQRPQMIVDANKLKEVNSELIANISLDLDLTAMDWYEIDDQ